MKIGVRENWPLLMALFVMLSAATFGFWGEQLMPVPATPPGPRKGSEPWLAHPLAPVRTDHVSMRRYSVQDALTGGRNPFLTAWEARFFGPEAGDAVAYETGLESDPWPELRAVIQSGDKKSVMLNSSVAGIGQHIEGVEVVEVGRLRVLVKGDKGSQWLDIAADGRFWRVEAN